MNNMSVEEYKKLMRKQNRKRKYRNTKIYVYDGVAYDKKADDKKADMTFDSIKEYNRYKELQILEKAGEISGLCRQYEVEVLPDFEYQSEKIKGIKYKADFMYYNKDKVMVVEDVKPFDKKKGKHLTTKDFNLKWKLLRYKYPERIFVLY